MDAALHIVFTAYPGPGNECAFVECETPDGKSVNAGEWRDRTDGLVELVVPAGDGYDRGRRDVLNALLALNPRVAQKLHMIGGGTEHTFSNSEGKLPFDVVFWVTEVAEQLGIKPRDEVEP